MTISYELAKELKDAGFPQHGGELDIPPVKKYVVPNNDGTFIPNSSAYVPTLEELIEACGTEFVGALIHFNGEWQSVCGTDMENFEKTSYRGSTPAEAVARLWLALNKK